MVVVVMVAVVIIVICNWQKGRVNPQFNSQSPGGDMNRSARLSHSPSRRDDVWVFPPNRLLTNGRRGLPTRTHHP